jgi:membrane protein implicated in regulation of membrane protease activity
LPGPSRTDPWHSLTPTPFPTTLLCIAIGGAVAYFLNWPVWAGYAIVAVLLLAGAYLLAHFARGRMARIPGLPKTTETVKENLAWIQSKSSEK